MSHNFKDLNEIVGEHSSTGWYSITTTCWANEKDKEQALLNDIKVLLGVFKGYGMTSK